MQQQAQALTAAVMLADHSHFAPHFMPEALQSLADQFALAAKVVDQGAGGESRPLGDQPHGRAVDAALHDDGPGGIDDAISSNGVVDPLRHQNRAMGFSGEPVAPGILSAAIVI